MVHQRRMNDMTNYHESTLDILTEMEDSAIIEYIYNLNTNIADKQKQSQQAQYILFKRMEANNASIIRHGNLEAKLKFKPVQYDKSILFGLQEVLDPTVFATVYTAPYEYPEIIKVPENWDGRVIRGLGKFGKPVQDILERAKLPNPPVDIEISEVEKLK